MNINTINNLNIITGSDYAEKLLFNILPPKKRSFTTDIQEAETDVEPETIDTILFQNRLLSLRIEQYSKYIEKIKEQMEHNNAKLDKLCVHKWSRDTSEIERTSYFCGRCGMTR